MKFYYTIFLFILSNVIFSQIDTSSHVTISGYGELYYSYDFSKPIQNIKPDFIYNHKRHNELNVNLMLLKANYQSGNIDANFGWMMGNYSQYNLAAEPIEVRGIYEATIGIKLSNKNNVRIDAGIMPSHIGFESAVGADCFTLTRSLVAENSPYYETGIKLSTISKNKKLSISGLLLNGWQKIQRTIAEETPSYGLQLQYNPNSNVLINYSGFYGNNQPDTSTNYRFYHNLYTIIEAGKKTKLILSVDYGIDKKNNSKIFTWVVPTFILKRNFSEKNSVAIRMEYFDDPNNIILKVPNATKADIFGSSINFDRKIFNNLLFRIEAKNYYSSEKIFTLNKLPDYNNFSLTTSLCVKF
jgi:hypothetical protein